MSDNSPTPLQVKIASDLPNPTNPHTIQKFIRGELFELMKGNSPESIGILMATALYEPSDPIILEDCVFTLQILAKDSNASAIDGLLTLAVIYSNEQAAAWLTSNKFQTKNNALLLAFKLIYVPKEPIEVNKNTYRLLNSLIVTYPGASFRNKLFSSAQSVGLTQWVHLAKFILLPDIETSQTILNNFGGMNRQVQDLTVDELADYSKDGNSVGENLLCQIAVHYDNQNAWNKAIENNAKPIELNDLAIFLFLSEQWDEYEQLDFNGQIIANA
ncbi:MAG: hypothetical protein HGA53_02005, partial [Anaerolineaceae bacterium]|nr:hypothetical protein [Anaerolineaceae bacterium]